MQQGGSHVFPGMDQEEVELEKNVKQLHPADHPRPSESEFDNMIDRFTSLSPEV